MRTNIELDDDLIRRAMELGDLPTKRAAVAGALKEFVDRRERRDLRDLLGGVEFAPGYDYKALRSAR